MTWDAPSATAFSDQTTDFSNFRAAAELTSGRFHLELPMLEPNHAMTETNPVDSQPMSVKDWVITLIILALPLINIVMLLVWAFGSSGNVNRKNYCLASLLMLAIIVGLSLCFAILAALVGMAAGGMAGAV
jgi:sterol desaturase/sphingolipid hydroxylase (fatty acid hydroxylase superfamily)